MSLRFIAERLDEAQALRDVDSWVASSSGPAAVVQIKGAAGSLPAFVVEHVHRHSNRPVVVVCPTEDDAAYLCSDLEQMVEKVDQVQWFVATGQKYFDRGRVADPGAATRRTEVVQQLAAGFQGITVMSVPAITRPVSHPARLDGRVIDIAEGMEAEPRAFGARLSDMGFSRVEFVDGPGEFALRGGILDVFPFNGMYPLRLEYFGDEVESIREFDPATQRSISRKERAKIVGDLSGLDVKSGGLAHIFEFIPPQALLVWVDQPGVVGAFAEEQKAADEAQRLRSEAAAAAPAPALDVVDGGDPDSVEEEGHEEPFTYYFWDMAERRAILYPNVIVGVIEGITPDAVYSLAAQTHPSFNGNMKLLRETLRGYASQGMETVVLCDSRGQEGRLFELLDLENKPHLATLRVDSLHAGFGLKELSLWVLTDHQLFDRYHRPSSRRKKKTLGGISLRELRSLRQGDFVTHIDFGVGRFDGLETIEVRGKQQEAVRLLYRDADVLYVNVSALYKLHRYSGKEGHQPELTKLGSGQWEKAKARTKKRIKDIARDLIRLYAKRKQMQGFAFSPDSVWQREMEISFQYEDTPDQAAAADAVKHDMEQATPMDRLVCGDVGFGKTEVAIRAAFKAVQDGKQVAVLVPTTILASQHAQSFTKRLNAFPVRIEVVSRFRSAAEIKQTLKDVADGRVDVLIGTHRLLSKDVIFKDLGLLIVDEEQRFGVSAKEKLRSLRVNVDTLTLTATPIPRTLQFSLLGARDLSIIATPPPNRQPIVTEIHTFDKDLIRDAIIYETSRGGQVFFVHNRVQSIFETADVLQGILPDTRFRVAHGQMKGSELEAVMEAFENKEFDVLISTSIVENGVDISNANTIIIDRASGFGLSELHQLRGRVGRSDRKAFCYLLVPTIHGLTREGRARLQAVEEFSDLGSGFQIAMRDLDIRGAGNILGAEQSGFIAEVGFETYHKILDEAVEELRTEEFADLFSDVKRIPKALDTSIDVEADALIPPNYIQNGVERLTIYRQISEATDAEQLAEVRTEIADRFGPIPIEVDDLLKAAALKLDGARLRLYKVVFKNQRLFLELPKPSEDQYFQELVFKDLLELLSKLDRRFVLKESKSGRLRAIIQDVPDLDTAVTVLARVIPDTLKDVAEDVA